MRGLAWALGAALVSAVTTWWLMPQTPSASDVAARALDAAVGRGTPSQMTERIEAAIPADARVIVVLGRSIPAASRGSGFIPGITPSTAASPSPSKASSPASTPATSPASTPATSPASTPATAQGQPSQVTILAHAASADTMAAQLKGTGQTTAVAFSQPTGIWVMAALPLPGGASAVLVAAALSFLAGLGGAFLGHGRGSRDDRPRAAGVPPPVGPVPAETDSELRRLRAFSQQRTMLARKLAELLPQMPEALAWQASKALNEAGVMAYIPDGEAFDPALHHAAGTEPTTSGNLENTIARTIRPGFRDSHQVLVYPKVVIYVDASERGAHERG